MQQALQLLETANRNLLKRATAYIDSDCGKLSVYARVQNKRINGQLYSAFVFAQVVVVKARQRGRGTFKAALASVEQQMAGRLDTLVVELVQNSRLGDYLTRVGYTAYDCGSAEVGIYSYYKHLKGSEDEKHPGSWCD